MFEKKPRTHLKCINNLPFEHFERFSACSCTLKLFIKQKHNHALESLNSRLSSTEYSHSTQSTHTSAAHASNKLYQSDGRIMNPVTTQKLSVRRKSVAFSPGNEYTYGTISARVKCQFCEKEMRTETKPRAGMITWFACGLTALLGCFCGCCLIR